MTVKQSYQELKQEKLKELQELKKRLENNEEIDLNEPLGFFKETYLMQAISYNAGLDILKLLISQTTNLDATHWEDWTALMHLAFNSDENCLKLLINAGADINFVNKYGDTALMKFAVNDHDGNMKLLIDAGAKLDLQSYGSNYSALMGAALFGPKDNVQLLIEAGARLDLKNFQGKTAYDISKSQNYANGPKITLLLKKAQIVDDLFWGKAVEPLDIEIDANDSGWILQRLESLVNINLAENSEHEITMQNIRNVLDKLDLGLGNSSIITEKINELKQKFMQQSQDNSIEVKNIDEQESFDDEGWVKSGYNSDAPEGSSGWKLVGDSDLEIG